MAGKYVFIGGSSTDDITYLPPFTGGVAESLGTKLSEIVSVKDFGALGDGITDDRAAVQAALSTGKGVYVPDGTYKITSGLTMSTSEQSLTFQSRKAVFQAASDFGPMLTLSASFLRITGGKLLGAASDTTSTSSGIYITNSTRGMIGFMHIEGFGYGIDGSASGGFAFGHTIIGCYLFQNKRCGAYGMGNSTTFIGGEIAGGVYGVMQAKLQAGSALAVDRDYSSQLGSGIILVGVTLESIYQTGTITGAANNGSGLVRITQVAHGYTTGDFISVSSIVGTTEANGVWPITKIDADHYDLKTSAFVNAYVSGGTARRGVAAYSGINSTGIEIIGGDWEDQPVLAQWGDAYKNDGTTAHSGPVVGGSVIGGNFSVGSVQSCLVAVGYVSGGKVERNSGFGTSTTLVNTRNVATQCEITKEVCPGFTREYDATGGIAQKGTVIKPVSGRDDIAFEVQVPTALGATTMTPALQIANHAGAYVVLTSQPTRHSALMSMSGAAATMAEATVTYSASMTIDASTGNVFVITATNGTAFTINAPTNPTTGQRITIRLRNTSGGALGAATWNAVFKMSAWTNPASANSRTIDFDYDGTNWIQASQTGVDVPN